MRPGARCRAPLEALVVLTLMAGAVGCRCGARTEPGAGAAPSASVGVLPPELAARTLARVGDRSITLGDYVAALERMDRFERIRYQSPQRRRALLDELIDVELLAGEARRRGLDRDPEVRARIDQVLRELVLLDLRESLPGPEAIPEAEVRAYYAKHREDFSVPERRRLSVIVLGSRDEAERVLGAARAANPTAWGELVRKHSLRRDPAGEGAEGLLGDVGFVTAPGTDAGGEVPEAVRRAGFAIPDLGGVFPQVVEADGRVYIVRLVSRNAAGLRSYAEAERTIRVTLAQQRIREAEVRLERELRARFEVRIDEAALAGVSVASSAVPTASATPGVAPSTREASGGDRAAAP